MKKNKKPKPCPKCPKLAAERDRLLSYRELYEKSQEQVKELQEALERAWKIIETKNKNNPK